MIDRRGARGDSQAGRGSSRPHWCSASPSLMALLIIVLRRQLAAAIDVLVDAAHGTT